MTKENRVLFTKEMKKTHKILIPNMMDTHFRIMAPIFKAEGYDVELLHNSGSTVVESGLKYVHNDTCYPALLVIGQMIDALNSGKYDLDKVALLITQTGGGCRASNYIHLLRKGLEKAGYSQIPVISLNLSGLENNPGFKLTFKLLRKLLAGVVYGDCIMQLSNQIRPYEITKGETDELVSKMMNMCSDVLNSNKGYKLKEIEHYCNIIVENFNKIKIEKVDKIKVGVVGEIYVKYAPLGNNHLEDFLKSQDVEYYMPGLMGFSIFKVDNRLEDIKLYGGNLFKKIAVGFLYDYLIKLEEVLYNSIKNNSDFIPIGRFEHTKKLVEGIVGYGSKMGEGWLLTAEMLELIEIGYENIICTQPFGCLPNHINGKGMIRKIVTKNPTANIVPIDYDPSATEVNQENRIKLMLAIAQENLENNLKNKDMN
ncbi:MAG: 2-hydroxyglutaryl-CoA dehydratase [Erysipelotrichaceae bacterium]|nr:2-hydroxyglutaryl-CoA dehydratase [Erysipelotrichaceae bacterium]